MYGRVINRCWTNVEQMLTRWRTKWWSRDKQLANSWHAAGKQLANIWWSCDNQLASSCSYYESGILYATDVNRRLCSICKSFPVSRMNEKADDFLDSPKMISTPHPPLCALCRRRAAFPSRKCVLVVIWWLAYKSNDKCFVQWTLMDR